MAVIDRDTIWSEDVAHLGNDGLTSSLNTIRLENGVDIIGVDLVEINVLIRHGPHTVQVGSFRFERALYISFSLDRQES